MISHRVGLASLLGLFAASSIVFTWTLLQFILSTHGQFPTTQLADRGSPTLFRPALDRIPNQIRDDYTYVDDDFPAQLPGFDPGHVQMVAEESVRFSIRDAAALSEWASTSPPGEGSVRLGPDGRLFYLSMFHELHCLRRFHEWFKDPRSAARPGVLGHTQHCLNYLRQLSLCRADRTLEAGDFMTRNLTADRVWAVHTCRDWSRVYDRVTYEWSNWMDATASESTSDKF